MIQQFDAIAFETEREEKFNHSRSIQLEISSHHNYSEGITYFSLHNGDLELGQFYHDPWGNGWYWMSSITGEKAHCPSRAICLTKIQQVWMRWAS